MINVSGYSKLPITEDFMFSKVFSDEYLCKKLIELLLGMVVDEITFIESQVTIKDNYASKGVKLDILVKIGGNYYNIEMQNKSIDDLINRSIYYRTLIHSYALKKGAMYEALPQVSIIFICGFDAINQGLPKYTFITSCEENDKIVSARHGIDMFVDITAHEKENDIALKNLMLYFTTEVVSDQFTQEIHDALQKARLNQIWRNEYMKYAIVIKHAEAKGEILNSLKLAQKMIEKESNEYIADFVELPIEQIQALDNGCSIEEVVEKYYDF